DSRQMGQRSELRGYRDVLVGLRDNRRFAGERVPHQHHLLRRSDQKGVKAVDLFKGQAKRLLNRIALAHTPLQKAAGGLAVVVGFKSTFLLLKQTAQAIWIRQRPVMD